VEIQVTGKYSPAAAIWTAGGNYVAVEWTVLLVSLASGGAFILATGKRFGDPRRNAPRHGHCDSEAPWMLAVEGRSPSQTPRATHAIQSGDD
jgi:hypothetical protein